MNVVQFVYASSALDAHDFANRRGWRTTGRAGWMTPDGEAVLFLCLLEQLEAVTPGTIVYDAGMCAEAINVLRARKAAIRR